MNLDAAVKIAATVTGQSAVDGLKNSLDGVSKGVEGVTNRFAGLAGSVKMLAGALGILGLGAMVKEVINAGEELWDMSQKTGVSVEALSTFKANAQLVDMSLEDLGKAITKFDVNLSKATTGSKEAAAAFRAMHLDAGVLKNMKVEDALLKVADAFAAMPNGVDKTRIAVELFGKSGAAMIPLLNAGSEAIQAMGVKMTTDFASRADQFNDNLTIMGAKVKVFAMQAAQAMLPTLQEIATQFLNLASTKTDVAGFFDWVAEAARLLSVALVGTYNTLANLIDAAVTAGRMAYAKLSGDSDKVDQLMAAMTERTKNRVESMKQISAGLLKNSLVFGEGTVDEIKRRQLDENAIKLPKGTTAANTGALDRSGDADAKKLEESIKQYQLATDKIRAETAAIGESVEAKKELMAIEELHQKGIAKTNAAYQKLKDDRIAALKEQRTAERSFDTGMKSAFDDYLENATNTGKHIKDAMTSAFKGMEDALVNFVMTGKFKFNELVTSILSSITRMVMQEMVIAPMVQALKAMIYSADGNVFNSGQVTKFASGGAFTNSVVSQPTMAPMAMFGEAGPEAIMPLSRGADGKLGVKSSGAGTTNITVNVATDGSTTTKGDAGTNAQQLGRAIAGAVRQELINQKRPGGILAPGANV